MVANVERESVEFRRSKVCRRLFVDSDEDCVTTQRNNKQYIQTEVENKLNVRLQKKIEEWNFDFVKGLPLKGRFDWIPFSEDSENNTTTNFEKSQKLRPVLRFKISRKDSSDNCFPYNKNQRKKSHQTILKDFFKTIKRPNCSTSKVVSSSSSSSSHANSDFVQALNLGL